MKQHDKNNHTTSETLRQPQQDNNNTSAGHHNNTANAINPKLALFTLKKLKGDYTLNKKITVSQKKLEFHPKEHFFKVIHPK